MFVCSSFCIFLLFSFFVALCHETQTPNVVTSHQSLSDSENISSHASAATTTDEVKIKYNPLSLCLFLLICSTEQGECDRKFFENSINKKVNVNPFKRFLNLWLWWLNTFFLPFFCFYFFILFSTAFLVISYAILVNFRDLKNHD